MHASTRLLMEWYACRKRDLPWRGTRGPYGCWVAEIMLQQTRVDTVIDYYRAFMVRFPTVQRLAEAPEQDVLSLWAGLGYYSRARNLHRAARQVAESGAFPASVEGWRALAGVGDYTAAAVASMALGLDAVAVDGNVRRVISRLRAITEDPTTPSGTRHVEREALCLLPPGQAGDFNQALMDLGATICKPRQPDCPHCPMGSVCLARQEGLQHTLPVLRKKRAPKPTAAVAGLWRRGDTMLVARRPPEGLLGGLWDLPGGRLEEGESHPQGVARLFRERLGVEVEPEPSLGTVQHLFTHLQWQAEVIPVHGDGEPEDKGHYADWCWCTPASVRDLPLSRLAQKTLALVSNAGPRQLRLL